MSYPVDRWGRAGAGVLHVSAGAAPFGFSFGKRGALNVTEAAASALTSYDTSTFAPITASLVNGQGAACWAASTASGRYTFTANAATDSISAYSQEWNGTLSLVTPGGATAQLAAGTHLLDEAVSHDRFLYVNGGHTGQISAFKIGWSGSLTPLGTVGALPEGFGGLVVSSCAQPGSDRSRRPPRGTVSGRAAVRIATSCPIRRVGKPHATGAARRVVSDRSGS